MTTFVKRRTRTAAIVAVVLAGSSLAAAQVLVTPIPVLAGPPLENAPIGGLQIDVEPRSAQVYVDGRPAGVVSDFSGYYKHMDIGAGPHLITILAPHYDPLVISVMVIPGHTITYRGSLTRAYGW
jgi:hypothetical protein